MGIFDLFKKKGRKDSTETGEDMKGSGSGLWEYKNPDWYQWMDGESHEDTLRMLIDTEGDLLEFYGRYNDDNSMFTGIGCQEWWGGIAPEWQNLSMGRMVAEEYFGSYPPGTEAPGLLESTVDGAKYHMGDLVSQDPALYIKHLLYYLVNEVWKVNMAVSDKMKMPSTEYFWSGNNETGYTEFEDEKYAMWWQNEDAFNGWRTDQQDSWNKRNIVHFIRARTDKIIAGLDGIGDEKLKAMMVSYTERIFALGKEMFMRLSGFGQRVQRIMESVIEVNGLPVAVNNNGTISVTHELEDPETVEKNFIILDLIRPQRFGNGLENGLVKDRYIDNNADRKDYRYPEGYRYPFNTRNMSMSRIASLLSFLYCLDYAIKNLTAYRNFVWPAFTEKEYFAGLAEIENYISFKHPGNTPEKAKFDELVSKIAGTGLGNIRAAMQQCVEDMHHIVDSTARGVVSITRMLIGRGMVTEDVVIKYLANSMWHKIERPRVHIDPVVTPQARYFIPWSNKPGNLLEIGTSCGTERKHEAEAGSGTAGGGGEPGNGGGGPAGR